MDAPFRELIPGPRKELEPFSENGIDYTLRIEVDASSQADPKFLRVVRVVVRWDYKGRAHQLLRELWRHRLPHQR